MKRKTPLGENTEGKEKKKDWVNGWDLWLKKCYTSIPQPYMCVCHMFV